jgi:4-methyl-5(b-hydroxyethyl)-thiazole monophosphate biosynthesis
MELKMDCLISDLSALELDALVLPGGLPGSTNLRDDEMVIELIRLLFDAGKIVAAVCAAPIALAKAGIMKGKVCTGYPMPMLREALDDANYTSGRVETDGNIVTGKGPGAAAEFAFAVASRLGAESQARQLAKMMFVDWE